jgi:hypothetical protein
MKSYKEWMGDDPQIRRWEEAGKPPIGRTPGNEDENKKSRVEVDYDVAILTIVKNGRKRGADTSEDAE